MSFFVSTRNSSERVNSLNAILNGLSSDGGLYAPVCIPEVDYKCFSGLSFAETAKKILYAWFDDFSEQEISDACDEAYLPHFDTEEICPVVKAGNAYITELFHGETCAFKDVALSLLPRLMTRARAKTGLTDKIMILTATSGDTGSAAMNGFRDVPGTGIITFFPNNGVSPVQRRQMVCMPGQNLTACAVNGNFDDCQSAVKAVFASVKNLPGVRLSSANSINIARLVPQITYYFTTYAALVRSGEIIDGEKLSFVVPTGNFGDILAGYYAKRMGLPVGRLICASNANKVLTEFIATGTYNKNREFLKTYSPSMDILISSNLERLLYHAQNENSEAVNEEMLSLKENGAYTVSGQVLNHIQKDFAAYAFDDNDTLKIIREFFDETGYISDPHTAVGICALKAYKAENPNEKAVVLSTASPFKFAGCVFDALSLKMPEDAFDALKKLSDSTLVKAPQQLMRLSDSNELHTEVIEKDDIKDYVLRTYAALL